MSRDKKAKAPGTTRNPKVSKVPAPGKPSSQLYRDKLGERLNVNWDFNQYIKKVQLSWNQLFLQKQTQLQKMEGGVPEIIDRARRRNRLISRGRSTFRNMSKKVVKAGDFPPDVLLAWEATQRPPLKELLQEIIQELLRKPRESRRSGASAPPNTPESSDRGLVSPIKADQISSQKVEEFRSVDMMVETKNQDLPKSLEVHQVSTDSPRTGSSLSRTSSMDNFMEMLRTMESPSSSFALRSSPESLESQPMSLSSSSLNLDSPELEEATDLVSGLLSKIQDVLRTYSDLSLPGVSSGESSELQSFPTMDMDGRRSNLASSVSSDITLMDLETSFHGHPESSSCSPVTFDGQMISPDSEMAMDLVNSVLKWILDSSNLETAFHTHLAPPTSSNMSSSSEEQKISPHSEAAMNLVRDVLRKIQNSPSSESSLTETSSRVSFIESPSSSVSLRSSPASFESSDIILIDLETSLDSQTVSPDSEVAMDLVSGVLRRIEDSPCSGLSPLDLSTSVGTPSVPSSHDLENLEVTDAAADIVDSVLQDLESEIWEPDVLAAGEGSTATPTSTNTPTGTKKSKIRKRVHGFFSRSWESVRQIFSFARRSNKVQPACL